MSYKSVVPLRLIWAFAGTMALLSLYVAFSGYGVRASGPVTSVVKSVALLPKPAEVAGGSSNSSTTTSTTLAESTSKKNLIEVSSSSPVLNYTQDSKQLKELSSSNSGTKEGDTGSHTPSPAGEGSDRGEQTTTTVARAGSTQGDSGSTDGSRSSANQDTSTTEPKVTTTTSTTSTTSTTLAEGDRGSSKGEDD